MADTDNIRKPAHNVRPQDTSIHSAKAPPIGRAADTRTRIPYENTAEGEDDTPVEHTYQTADGTEETESIRSADATFVPVTDTEPLLTSPQESVYGVPEGEPTDATRPPDGIDRSQWKKREAA